MAITDLNSSLERPVLYSALLAIFAYITVQSYAAAFNLYIHPLCKFPGPKLAALTARRKAFIELILRRSWHIELEELHRNYGPVVRVGPNELHFSSPQAYLDIYNQQNRWDKEESLYRSFGEDRSSFGFLTYKESKERKDVLNKSFSAANILNAAPLVKEKVEALCGVFANLTESKVPADLNWAFRCMTMDIITYLSFGNTVDAIHAPGFKAPILIAMDASTPIFVAFKHLTFYKNMIMNCPPRLSKILSLPTAGLVDLQQLLGRQISELTADPSKLNHLPHNMTIYHSLLNKDAYKNRMVPSAGSLYEEAQALMFAGADTVGNTLMVAIFNLLTTPSTWDKLKAELLALWSDPSSIPELRILEKQPYLNAVIKEALRLSTGVVSGLPRIVPSQGAIIAGVSIPGGTIVSIGSTFVHYNEKIFTDPTCFRPERWLDDPKLDTWLIPFSRGPRMCLGINLAWMELRFALATVVRRFDMALDGTSPKELIFRDCFLPEFQGPHVKAYLMRVTA